MSSPGERSRNVDDRVVEAFGAEWSRFTSEKVDIRELEEIFESYTAIFPWADLPPDPVGFDAGCGTGRWARFFAPRVGRLYCVDASDKALRVARRVLADQGNVEFRQEDLGSLSLSEASCDFGYALGVLHHVPDTEAALKACVARLKPGAPFLVYLYYDLQQAGRVTRLVFSLITGLRYTVARLPFRVRVVVTDVLAGLLYFPLARLARLLERAGRDVSSMPLFQYRHRSFYTMRNDALDRFGTRIEKRYSRPEVQSLLEGAGLERVVISDDPPWWVAVGRREEPVKGFPEHSTQVDPVTESPGRVL